MAVFSLQDAVGNFYDETESSPQRNERRQLDPKAISARMRLVSQLRRMNTAVASPHPVGTDTATQGY